MTTLLTQHFIGSENGCEVQHSETHTIISHDGYAERFNETDKYNHLVYGNNLLFNPSGIPHGETAKFWLWFDPPLPNDILIEWVAKNGKAGFVGGNVSFQNGNNGFEMEVSGDNLCDEEELRINIPKFNLYHYPVFYTAVLTQEDEELRINYWSEFNGPELIEFFYLGDGTNSLQVVVSGYGLSSTNTIFSIPQ